MATSNQGRKLNLPAEVNRILFVRNIPFKMTPEELYELFGRFGTIRQIRKFVSFSIRFTFLRGSTNDTKGTCFVVYDDIFDAKEACESLSGYNYQNRYLVVNYYNQQKWELRVQKESEKKEMDSLKKKWGATTVQSTTE